MLHLAGGGTSIWDDYEELRDHWFLNAGWGMSHIEVKDRKQTKKTKGFK